MKTKIIFLFIVCLSGFCLRLPDGYAAITVKASHPRLLSLPDLAKDGQNASLSALFKQADFFLTEDVSAKIRRKDTDRELVRLYSLTFALKKDSRYLKQARDLVNVILNASIPGDDQHVRTRLQALAYYYDLCFSALRAEEKIAVQDAIIRHIEWLDKKKYLKSENYGGGHQHYAVISAIIGCLSIYHESPVAREWLPLLERQMKDGFLPFFSYLAKDDGGFHMWWEYGRYYIQDELEFYTIWKNATGEDLFVQNAWLNNTFEYLLYGLRGDLTYWGTGDNHAREVKLNDSMIFNGLASQYGNKYSQYLTQKLNSLRKWPGVDELFYEFLWRDETVVLSLLRVYLWLKNLSESVPMFFGKGGTAGVFVFREGWNDDNVAALFKCTPTYFFNHSHRDANSFEIWYKGDLAVDSGYYDAYGSEHWFNYYIRTIAHNTVLIFDPQEKIANWDKIKSNDGGQRFSQHSHEQPYNVEDLKNEAFHVADSSLVEDNENYALAVGDATRSYSPKKCELFKRYFLWLKKVDGWNHPVIVVLDRVISTKPEFKKTWLLHSINKPQVKDGLITIINGDGKLWCQVIEPKDYKIEIVGGPGREFEVQGVNYPPKTRKEKDVQKWAGSWRIELSEKNPQKETFFLNVLVPSDSNQGNLPMVESINHGVKIGNWQVIYNNKFLVSKASPDK